ncbi:hypothetical protein [Ferruginibacter sp.]
MKKSNRILLGGFLTVVLLITGIHIALYAKYRNGHYTISQPDNKRGKGTMQSFPEVSVIMMQNVSGASIIFGDALEVEKGKEEIIETVKKGDSVIITGRGIKGQVGGPNEVRFTLPRNVTISALNSFIYFDKGKDDSTTNPTFYLQKSHIDFGYTRKPIQLGNVKVFASDNSLALFEGYTQVSNLEILLRNSALEYREGDIGQLSIATDSSSRFILQSKHLLKAKITSVPSNP